MLAKDIIKQYPRIKVLATDGNEYYLTEYYPLCMPIKNDESNVYLDTGGQMADCDFFMAKIEDNKLFRQSGKKWHKIATLKPESLIAQEVKSKYQKMTPGDKLKFAEQFAELEREI